MSDILSELLYECSNVFKVIIALPILVLAIYNMPIGLVYMFGVKSIGFELVHNKKGKRFVDMGAKEIIPMTLIVSVISTLMYLGLYFIYLKV